jgi:hypothetical protein
MAAPNPISSERWARRAGFLCGLALVAVALLAWRIPPGEGRLVGADLIFSSGQTGELAVSPAGPFLTLTSFGPASGIASGEFQVVNRTGRRLAVHVRAEPDSEDLDRLLRVRLSAGSSGVARGELGRLRAWSTRPFVLGSGERRRVELEAWFPRSLNRGYVGTIETVSLQLQAQVVGR